MGDSWEWTDLRYFIAVHRAGSMGKAAATLGVNASTVSRRLSALEEALDVRLFERLPEGARPTQEGSELIEAAVAAEAAFANFARLAARDREQLSGRVRISAAPASARQFVQLMPLFYKAYPHIIVEWVTTERAVDLGRREADIAIRFFPPRSPDLIARRIGEFSMHVYASPAYLDGCKILSVESLDWVIYGNNAVETDMGRWGAQHIPQERQRLVTSDLTLMIEAVRCGIGVGLLPGALVRSAAPDLVELRLDLPQLPATPVWLVAHSDLNEIPRIRVLWDYLCTELPFAKKS